LQLTGCITPGNLGLSAIFGEIFVNKLFVAAALASLGFATDANASTTWTVWTSSTVGTPTGGSAAGTAGSVGVSYSGEVYVLDEGLPDWTPTSTWVGGIATSAPLTTDGAIRLTGGPATGTDTIVFSRPVYDPVIAIWSLGSEPPNANAQADMIFSATPTIEAGGLSTEYGGQSITLLPGNDIHGAEGNGSVAFFGTYSKISFTTPNNEYYYDFTVGVSSVPEPATWAMMTLGFAGLGYAGFRRAKKSRVAIA
jgi:hypothetical protein